MEIVLHCKQHNIPFVELERPVLTETDCAELINCSEHDTYECEIYAHLYDNDGVLLAVVGEPAPKVIKQPIKTRWWKLWRKKA